MPCARWRCETAAHSSYPWKIWIALGCPPCRRPYPRINPPSDTESDSNHRPLPHISRCYRINKNRHVSDWFVEFISLSFIWIGQIHWIVSAVLFHEGEQNGFLGMQAVLRLLKDDGVRGIDHGIRNLFASVGGKTMHEDIVRLRPAHN
jgi:hypothetical protein